MHWVLMLKHLMMFLMFRKMVNIKLGMMVLVR